MEVDKCSNYSDEIRKATELTKEMRIERDEVRSTLSKIPTCVICLENRVCASSLLDIINLVFLLTDLKTCSEVFG